MKFTELPPRACTDTGLLTVVPFAGEQITVAVAVLGCEQPPLPDPTVRLKVLFCNRLSQPAA
jgi:hypothetical protein